MLPRPPNCPLLDRYTLGVWLVVALEPRLSWLLKITARKNLWAPARGPQVQRKDSEQRTRHSALPPESAFQVERGVAHMDRKECELMHCRASFDRLLENKDRLVCGSPLKALVLETGVVWGLSIPRPRDRTGKGGCIEGSTSPRAKPEQVLTELTLTVLPFEGFRRCLL